MKISPMLESKLTFSNLKSKNIVRIFRSKKPNTGNVPVVKKNYKNIVFIGASITNGAFGQDLTTPHAEATQELGMEGVNVYGWGWPGSTIGSYVIGRNFMQEALDAFPSDTLFHIHLGGNDLTQNRPWGSVESSVKDDIKNNWQLLMDTIGDRKDDCIFSPITFRDYDDLARYDGSLSSLPFNQEIILPFQNTAFKNGDGYPITDWYGWSVNNQAMFHSDGVHMSAEGYRRLRKDSVERLSMFLKESKLPPTFNHTVPHIPTNNPTSYVLNFGVSAVNNNLGTPTIVKNSTPVSLLRNDRMNSNLTWKPIALDPTVGVGLGIYLVYCDNNYDNTLQSDPFYRDTFFIKEGNSITHELTGLSPNQRVKIELVGHRPWSSDRWTEVIDFNDPLNKVEYNTSLLPPQQSAELTIQADATGKASFITQSKQGSQFAYVGGILFTPL